MYYIVCDRYRNGVRGPYVSVNRVKDDPRHNGLVRTANGNRTRAECFLD